MKVKPHTSLKHRMLGAYFRICREVAKNRILYYIDLYCGDGECECDEAPLKKWKCPFIQSLLEHAQKGEIKLKCFFNELDPENEGLFEKLKINIAPYSKFLLDEVSKEDANTVYIRALKMIPADEWSIVFIDPYKYSDLKWRTIEEISKHEKYDEISKCVRKPELIINLMTCTMQRSFIYDSKGITEFLGNDEWKSKIRGKDDDEKVYEIFLEIFTKQLEKLGYVVTSIKVTQTLPNNNTLYYMIHASNIPRANSIIHQYKSYIDTIMKDKWIKENFISKMSTQARKGGNTLLSDF